MMTFANCRNCGYPITLFIPEKDVWGHIVPGRTMLPRGCRAASFDRLGDWDDSLSESLKARPAKGTESEEPTREVQETMRQNESDSAWGGLLHLAVARGIISDDQREQIIDLAVGKV